MGIEARQWLDPHQGGKEQRLQTAQQGLVAVMSQSKIGVGMTLLIDRDGLCKAGDNWCEATLLIEPTCKEMHAYKRQMGCDLDQRPDRTNRTAPAALARSAFGPIQLPFGPQAVEMAHAHVHGDLTLDHLVAHDPAWALRVLVEHLPHYG